MFESDTDTIAMGAAWRDEPNTSAAVPDWLYPMPACQCTVRSTCAPCMAYWEEHWRSLPRRSFVSHHSRLEPVHEELLRHYTAGVSLKTLSDRYQVAPNTLRSYLQKRGLFRVRPHAFVPHGSRLEQVHEALLAQYAAGVTLAALGRQYGVTPSTIRSYLRRRGLAMVGRREVKHA